MTQTTPQIKNPKSEIVIDSLTAEEIDLIYKIRTKYRFGEIVVETRNGHPYRIKKTIEYELLG